MNAKITINGVTIDVECEFINKEEDNRFVVVTVIIPQLSQVGLTMDNPASLSQLIEAAIKEQIVMPLEARWKRESAGKKSSSTSG